MQPRAWIRRWVHRIVHPTPLDLLLLVIVAGAVLGLAYEYHMAPVPPGGDSGHWVTTSYAYIGRAHPSDFTDQAFLYPPLLFPLIGSLVLLTGSPLSAGFATGELLLALFGLSTIHLARRFLRSGPGQLLFVGLAVLNGTTVQMLFWGGFPNFLAFTLLNEAMVFLLAFWRTRGSWEAVLFWGFAAALYLTHNLTFVVLVGAVSIAGLLLLLTEGRAVRRWLTRGFALGLLLFAGAVGLYVLATRAAGVIHPGYLFANPATYVVDSVGLVFRPFYYAPAFYSGGTPLVFDPGTAVAILLGCAGALGLVLLVVGRLSPAWAPPRVLMVGAWIMATLLVPAAGYLLHVDTDYPRFAYFFALPVALGVAALGEIGTHRLLLRGSRAGVQPVAVPPPRPSGRRRTAVSVGWLGSIAAVAFVALTVTAPVMSKSESLYISPSHDALFLEATDWLNHHAGPGAVLTDAGDSARWIEALTARTAFSSGLTWLHFYQQQIINDDLAYWALNGQYATTDGAGTFVYSGANATLLDSFPQYAGYVEGVPFPILRLAESTVNVSWSVGANTSSSTFSPAWGAPVFTLAPDASRISARFSTADFILNETASLSGAGTGSIVLDVESMPGTHIRHLSFKLLEPVGSRLGQTVGPNGITFNGANATLDRRFTWSVAGPVGPQPGSTAITTQGAITPAPDPSPSSFASPLRNPTSLTLSFTSDAPVLRVEVDLTTPGLSNPGVALPPTLSSVDFLNANSIEFLMVQNITLDLPTIALYEQVLGFSDGFDNAEWVVLQR